MEGPQKTETDFDELVEICFWPSERPKRTETDFDELVEIYFPFLGPYIYIYTYMYVFLAF